MRRALAAVALLALLGVGVSFQVTLAEVLSGEGYRTGAFVGAFVLDSRWGTNQGFDRYFDEFDLSEMKGGGMASVQRKGDEVEAAETGLAKNPESEQAPFGHYILADIHNRRGSQKEAARQLAAARKLEQGG